MLIKRLFNSSLIFANRMAYLKLLIFLPEILIPAYGSSSSAFLMRCSAYKLNKQGDDTQPWHNPFPVWNQSIVPCPVLTVVSWPAYSSSGGRSGGLVFPSLRIFQFVVIHTVKGFSIVNEAEIDVFLESSCFFYEINNLPITINCGKFWKRWEYRTTWPASWETYMQVRKQQLELDMEQQTGSK